MESIVLIVLTVLGIVSATLNILQAKTIKKKKEYINTIIYNDDKLRDKLYALTNEIYNLNFKLYRLTNENHNFKLKIKDLNSTIDSLIKKPSKYMARIIVEAMPTDEQLFKQYPFGTNGDINAWFNGAIHVKRWFIDHIHNTLKL